MPVRSFPPSDLLAPRCREGAGVPLSLFTFSEILKQQTNKRTENRHWGVAHSDQPTTPRRTLDTPHTTRYNTRNTLIESSQTGPAWSPRGRPPPDPPEAEARAARFRHTGATATELVRSAERAGRPPAGRPLEVTYVAAAQHPRPPAARRVLAVRQGSSSRTSGVRARARELVNSLAALDVSRTHLPPLMYAAGSRPMRNSLLGAPGCCAADWRVSHQM